MSQLVKDVDLVSFMRECKHKATQANDAQQSVAHRAIENLNAVISDPLKDKRKLGESIEQIFQEHGSIVGSIIMVEYVLPDVDPSFARKI